MYCFPGESAMSQKRVTRTSEEMIDYYESLLKEFPIVSIEDGLCEEDWEGWSKMTRRLGGPRTAGGGRSVVTNRERLLTGIRQGAGNSILVKVNQIGTLTEALDAVETAQHNGYRAVISHRSGRRRTPLSRIWQWPAAAARSKPALPVGQTGLPNIISCCESKSIWELPRSTPIPFQDDKKSKRCLRPGFLC